MKSISLSLEDKMNNFIEARCKQVGLRSRNAYLRRLIADDMDKQSERERPVINLSGSKMKSQ